MERALGLFDEMKQMDLTPTHVTFNAIIHATARSFRHYERAFNLFEEMTAAGYDHDTYSLNAVLLACRYGKVVWRAKRVQCCYVMCAVCCAMCDM